MWKIKEDRNFFIHDLDNLINLSYLNFSHYLKIYPSHWEKITLIYIKNEKIISFSNLFIIKKLNIKLFYIPGGIEGKIDQIILSQFQFFIHKMMNVFSILHINFHNNEIDKQILPKKFMKIKNVHETRLIMIKNLKNTENLNKTYSKNWRHNLNRSHNKDFDMMINKNPNLKELLDLYGEMSKLKNFKIQINLDYLERLFNNLSEFLIHYEARKNNKLIAFRTCIFKNNKAWDLLACSNIESKKNYCTYYIMHKIFQDLISNNILYYDFSGVDFKNNVGVYNFKKGAGSKEFRKIGEYIYSKNIILKLSFYIFIFMKRIFIK